MLNVRKSKIDLETQPHCDICKLRDTPLQERRTLIRAVTTVYNKNGCFIHDFNIEELLCEHNQL